MALDRAPDGGWVPGGPSLYSARAAAALGVDVRLVTHLPADYPSASLAGIDVVATPAADVPRYVNTYDAEGNRVQRLLSVGERLSVSPATCDGADALLVAPAFDEIAALPEALPRVTGISLQGALRARDGDRVVAREPAWDACAPLVRSCALYFFSEEDTPDAGSLATRIAGAGGTAFVTRGYRGVAVYAPGMEVSHHAAYPAALCDPTGAGDAFATAYTVRFSETGDLEASLSFARMAGALAVEGAGPDAMPSRAAIEARLRKVAA